MAPSGYHQITFYLQLIKPWPPAAEYKLRQTQAKAHFRASAFKRSLLSKITWGVNVYACVIKSLNKSHPKNVLVVNVRRSAVVHVCASELPWVSRNRRWRGRSPRGRCEKGERTCTRCPTASRPPAETLCTPPASATWCRGPWSHWRPWRSLGERRAGVGQPGVIKHKGKNWARWGGVKGRFLDYLSRSALTLSGTKRGHSLLISRGELRWERKISLKSSIRAVSVEREISESWGGVGHCDMLWCIFGCCPGKLKAVQNGTLQWSPRCLRSPLRSCGFYIALLHW